MLLQVIARNLDLFRRRSGHEFRNSGRDLRNDRVNELGRNGLSGVEARVVVCPLPELYTCDFRSGSVLHEEVEGNATVSADPSRAVCERSRYVGLDTLRRDRTLHFCVQEISGGDLEFFAANVVLRQESVNTYVI